jgi:hypothetical protein
MAKDLYRRGSGPWWFIALAFVLFSLYSLATAAATADRCDAYGGEKSWQIIPPRWECARHRG